MADLDFAKHLAYSEPLPERPTLAFEDTQHSLTVRARAFVFSDPRSKELLPIIERVAPSNATVLITGETGTGKELVARYLHKLSDRADKPFIAVNCGAFSESLIESELFGYEKGAFTGASQSRQGWFEAANGGTLFLDEIGDLPVLLQVKLLRVLQEREIVRLGSRKPIPLDVRLIAATNVNLRRAVDAGRFREDLYYRLHVIQLPLLRLRDRPADILPLVRHFMKHYSGKLKLPELQLTPDAESALLSYSWPGNIRELENLIHRTVLISRGTEISVDDLDLPSIPQRIEPASTVSRVENVGTNSEQLFRSAVKRLFEEKRLDLLNTMITWIVQDGFAHANKNQVKTAELLGVTRNVVRTYLKRVGLIT